jgi:hypothetical protein
MLWLSFSKLKSVFSGALLSKKAAKVVYASAKDSLGCAYD